MIRSSYLLAAGIAMAALLAALAGSWLRAKEASLVEREDRTEATMRQIREVLELRALRDRASADVEPEANLTSLVLNALRGASVPEDAFRGLAVEGGTMALPRTSSSGPGYLLRRASVRLSGVRLPDLGRFLDRWRTEQPLHVVTAIDLARSRGAGRGGENSGSEERFDATLVLSTYVVVRDNSRAGPPGAS